MPRSAALRPALLMSLVAGAAVAAFPGAAHAQNRVWNQTSDVWSLATNWTPNDIPNTAGETAEFGGASAYTCTVGASVTCGGFTITNPLATVAIVPARILTYAGDIVNHGTVIVNDTGGNSDTRLTLGTPLATISGGGAVVLNANALDLGTAYLYYTSSANVLNNAAGHTIRGTGRIYTNIANAGVIDANVSGRVLELMSVDKSNAGTMRATGGGTLRVASIGIAQSGGGQMIADAATLHLSGASVTNGAISAINGGTVSVTSNSTVQDVALSGAVNVAAGGRLNLLGSSLVNNATITINEGGTNSDTRFVLNAPALGISGTGTIALNASASDLDTAYFYYSSSLNVLTIGSGQTVRGTGNIYTNLVNNGVVSADVAGRTLQLFSVNKTNNNLMRAIGGGTLQIASINLAQGASGVVRADNGSVSLVSSSITGGALQGINGGSVTGSGVFGLYGVTNSAPVGASPSSQLRSGAAGLINNAVITINPAGANFDTRFTWEASGTLSGSGSVVLNANPLSLDTAHMYFTSSAFVLTHALGHTIRGTGNIYNNVTNNGVIDADQSGKVLDLVSVDKTNNNLMRASGGGTLRVSSVAISQGAGGIVRADNGTVHLSTGTITGGTIDAINGGSVIASGFSTLDSVASNAPIGVVPTTQLRLGAGGLTNNGTITVNSTGANNDTRFVMLASTSIGGTGTLLLNANPVDLDTAYIYYASSANTLTLGSGQTLAGNGRIYPTTTLNGTISPGITPGAIGRFEMRSPFTMTPSATFVIDIGGVAPAQYDRVSSTAAFTADGFFQVNLVNGFTNPAIGTEFDIVTAPTVNGACLSADLPTGWGIFVRPGALTVVYTGCLADLDCGNGLGTPDGGVDVNDLLYFLGEFEIGSAAADLDDDGDPTQGNPDGGTDINDLLFFLARFEQGC